MPFFFFGCSFYDIVKNHNDFFIFKKLLRGKKSMHPTACSTNLKPKKKKKKSIYGSKIMNFLLKNFIKESNLQVIQSKIYVYKHIKNRIPDFKEFYRLETQVRKNLFGTNYRS